MKAYILNLFDLCLTLHAVSHGGVELNPAMRCIPFQVIYKVIGVGLLCRWLSQRSEPIARYGLRICTAAFAAVDLWHIANILSVI